MYDEDSSGCALLTADGALIGLRVAAVGPVRMRIEQKDSLDEPLDEVEASLESATSSIAYGGIALLCTSFQ